jgi:hypothetical protein
MADNTVSFLTVKTSLGYYGNPELFRDEKEKCEFFPFLDFRWLTSVADGDTSMRRASP